MNKNLHLWQGSMVSQEDFDRIMENQAAWDEGSISESEMYDVQDDMRDKYPITADTMFMDYLLIKRPSEIFYMGTDRGNNKTIKQLWNEFLSNPHDVYDIMNLHDSENREQLFNAFENILGIDYDDSYELWLHNRRTPSMQVLDSVRIKDDAGAAMVLAYKIYSNYDGVITDDVEAEFSFGRPQIESFDQFVRKICSIAKRNNAEVSEFPQKLNANGVTTYVAEIDDAEQHESVSVYYVFVDTAVSTKNDVDPFWGEYMNQYGV